MCGCLSHTPYWRLGPQPRQVPSLGIEPTTPWFAGWHSIHWATPARAKLRILKLGGYPQLREWSLNAIICILLGERQREIWPYTKEKVMWRWNKEIWRHRLWILEGCSHQPRNVSSHQKLEKARNWFCCRVSAGSTSLPTPWFWPSDTNFGILASRIVREWIKSPCLWYFITAATGNRYTEREMGSLLK